MTIGVIINRGRRALGYKIKVKKFYKIGDIFTRTIADTGLMAWLSTINSMDKGLNLQSDDEFVFFQNLPDELVIKIFTTLSNSDAPFDTLNDLKLLGQCSTVCKQFNSLVCLVQTLSIKHPSCKTLYDYCPKILNKFKYIHSLQVKHWSCAEICINDERKKLPTIHFDVAYTPRSYSLVVVSYKKLSYYSDRRARDYLMLPDVAMEDGNDDLYSPTREHAFDLIRLHHMLVSSIKDHSYLQMVMVTDFSDRGTFTLDKEMLVELRNCSSINLEQVQGLDRSGFFLNLDFPFGNSSSGLVLYNICFNIIEWSEKSADDPIHKADADRGIPDGLLFKGSQGLLLKNYLRILLKNSDDNMLPAMYLSCNYIMNEWEAMGSTDGQCEVDVNHYLEILPVMSFLVHHLVVFMKKEDFSAPKRTVSSCNQGFPINIYSWNECLCYRISNLGWRILNWV
ncbi:uncharacterized protein LOC141711627 isoform X2 [Apium graveolens]|uniref:uncharacterized protein LOC141711627 isoform X2 n=1 Tax=Apium graveolens TaxID=4045 RepID=UPI003D79E39D